MEHFGEDKLTIQTARPRDSRFEPSVSNVSVSTHTIAKPSGREVLDILLTVLEIHTDYG